MFAFHCCNEKITATKRSHLISIAQNQNCRLTVSMGDDSPTKTHLDEDVSLQEEVSFDDLENRNQPFVLKVLSDE